MVHEALLYEKEKDLRVRCALCAHRCRIDAGARGICGVRENREGVLYSLVYGRVIAENVDPIEKKPLFHFLPGSRSFSIATAGCNFRCTFCQNHEISQLPREENHIIGRERTPAKIVEQARLAGCNSISYTYTEPTIYFEFAWDTAGIAREQGLKNVFVTNGYMTGETLELLAPRLDAANVDLKSFRDDFYKKECGARLQPVLDSLRRMKELGIWVEVTTLLIPGSERRRGGAPRHRRIPLLPRSGNPLAHQPFPPPVPNDEYADNARGLHPSGRGDRQSRRSEIHLLRKPPRRRR